MMGMSFGMSRRGFLGATGAAAVGVATGALASPASAEEPASADEGLMTDEEARQALLQEAEVVNDLVLDDGTVVPAVYVRVRNRMNRLGAGTGSNVGTDNNYWAFAMRIMSEEEAAWYLDMPMYKDFSVVEFADKSGRDEAECREMCDRLAERGIIYRMRRSGTPFYRLIPPINGVWEFSIGVWGPVGSDDVDREYLDAVWGEFADDYSPGAYDDPNQPPYFRTVPVSAEVLGGGTVLSIYDDFEKIIRRHDLIALGECVCRKNALGYGEDVEQANTEILCGEMAQYYIDLGIGWEITQDEAIAVLHDAVDKGLVIQNCTSKAGEIFCCCDGSVCKMLGGVMQMGGQGDAMKQYSRYNLEYDPDLCIQCGTCEGRCHLKAITIGADGRPETGPTCVRCGQCVVTCPVEARKLLPRDDYPELPDTLFDSYDLKAMERMKRGYITDYVTE